MSSRTKNPSQSTNVIFVPLDKLKKSPKNVRKMPHTKADITALAASIAAVGMLQYPVVEPEIGSNGKPTGNYLVNAGEGRRLAQLLRAKRKEIKADEPIPCTLDTEHSATEISLAENAVRTDMHPADQYEAFAKLHGEEGMSAEDIAARFGVTPTVVKQRLKLGAVSPKLRTLYRKGEMNLDQLSAFAITDDHERQERVWAEMPTYSRGREAILRMLSEGQIRSSDRRAIFVGAKAYETAGGIVIRDLFDAEGGGFFADAELLNRLTHEKLQRHADKLAAEGWRWIVAEPQLDHEACAGMRRVFAKPVPLSKAERKRLHKLTTRYDALCDKYPDGEVTGDDGAKLARIEAAIEALQRTQYKAQDIARAGAFVTLDSEGGVRVERGYLRPEDEPQAKTAKKQAGKPADEGPAPLSERLIADLTAHRTAGLRNELGTHPDVALIATVHALAAATFFPGTGGLSCLHIIPRTVPLGIHATGIEESPAWKQMAVRHEIWTKRMPSDPAELWTFVKGLPDSDRLDLLAHCVSLSVNAVQPPGHRGVEAGEHADVLARELALDMSTYWQPTADSYLGRVSKERICEAVREGASDDAAKRIAALKKGAMADAAAQLLAGQNWLPPLLRSPS